MPCHILLFPCYFLSLLEIISIRHCYTCHPEQHTHMLFSFPFFPSLTPSPALFSCTHLPPVVFSRALQNVPLLILKRQLLRAQFHLLFASTFSIRTHSSLVWLIIIYPLLSLTTCLVCFVSQKMKAVGNGCTGQIDGSALLLFPSLPMSCILSFHFSGIIYERLVYLGCFFFFFLNLKCPVPSVKILLQVWSVCLFFCEA